MGNNNHMNSNGESPMEVNQEMHDEPNDIRGIDLERQGILEEDETKINESAKDVKDDSKGDIVPPQPPPPPLGPIVRWERFLPVRSLNVLLVESDDSTRQLVSALLRNCSYEVTAAADAFQAWRILEDFTNRVDLILTEVNMRGLSGIGLLCKIMSHRTCKNIPVIMMSSNDSVGTVFKCLSKGAVDFLVKPIRKNELKNLWQHVWRRCHSSSGSGSESGIQHQKSTNSKSPYDSDDDNVSNEDDNRSFGQNLRDGSDNVSGTQSSWTKHAVEDDSPQQMSPSDPWADAYDNTCAQVIHSKLGVPKSTNKECREQKEVTDKNSLGKDLEKGAPQNSDRERVLYPTEKASSVTGASMERLPECNPKVEMNENVPGRESSNASCGPVSQAADLIDGIADDCEARLVSRVPETHDGFSQISKCKDKANEDSKELPTLDLSLKRLRSSGDGDDHNILRHSDLSAFSRYNSPTSQTPRRRGATCSNPHDTSEEIKSESTYSILNAAALKQGSNGSSNNNDMGSTTKDAFTKLPAHKEKITSTATAETIYPSTLHHTPHWPSANQTPIQEQVDDVAAQAKAGQARGVQNDIQVQHHHHHYHHHHHHVHSMQEQQPLPPPDHDDISLNNMVTTAPQCGSSNMFPGSMDVNAMNYSLNGSASGSNQISNGYNGSSKAVNTGAKNMESDACVAANGESGGTNLGDQNRFSQREVALNKFRQKRKERNFGKKVRYQSRKRLAEQRPRVRGQFVRRITHEHTSREGSS